MIDNTASVIQDYFLKYQKNYSVYDQMELYHIIYRNSAG